MEASSGISSRSLQSYKWAKLPVLALMGRVLNLTLNKATIELARRYTNNLSATVTNKFAPTTEDF